MNILILSTYQRTGGAAIAAHRLMDALNKQQGVTATMLSMRKGLSFYWERLVIFVRSGFSRRNLFAIDIANAGTDITRTEAFREADVIHLHWVNQGFLSLDTIGKILRSGKRILWTMHDQWPLTAICHYSEECTLYQSRCEQCPLCPALARSVFRRKERIYQQGKITFIGCSEWIANLARHSTLSRGHEVIAMPNPIDTELFRPQDRDVARKQLLLPIGTPLILFACQKVTDKRKGIEFLIEAALHLNAMAYQGVPATQGGGEVMPTIVLVGKNTEEVAQLLPATISTISLGTIGDVRQMAALYAAVDAFVTPSLQDNLPNTIMEAMACGTPCVGFNVGGIPEMIDHKQNGYVAHYCDAYDLAQGISYVLSPDNAPTLAQAARAKVMQHYSEAVVAKRLIEIANKKS
jgi:glycosyltransferase involved in cell wall biosynthesis